MRFRCYFARQEAICLSEDDTYDNYQSLFKAPDTDELTQQYEDIVRDSFTVVDPTFQGVFDSLDNTAYSPDVAAAKEICDANLWQSMALDKVRKHRTYFSPEFSYALTTCAVRRLVCTPPSTDYNRMREYSIESNQDTRFPALL